MSQEPSQHRGRNGRQLVVVLALLRGFALLVALQLGGIPHAATDVASAVFGIEQLEHEQCPDDGSCNDCLAGCPNCHCGSAMRVLVPEASVSLELAPGPASTASWSGESDERHPRPELPSVYRPPRARALRTS